MDWRKTIAACLPASTKRMIRELVCGPVAPASAPAVPNQPAPCVGLALARGAVLEIVPGDIISDSIAATGVWEGDLSNRLVALAREGGTMVEVGANIGYFSVLWAAQGPHCRVVAFEPSWRNLGILQRNVSGNRLGDRVDILPIAAGQNLGIARFDLGPVEQTGWGGIVTDARAGTVAVAVAPLDALLPADIQIAVLKIDVEGADTWVLHGCRELLAGRRISRIFYEQNLPRMTALGIDAGAAADFLASVGYMTRAISPPGEDVVEWEAWAAS